MNKEQALLILKSLGFDFLKHGSQKHVEALEYAINELERTAQEVPVQEQYVGNFNPRTGEKLHEVCPKCWVKGNKPYKCGFEKCPGHKLHLFLGGILK